MRRWRRPYPFGAEVRLQAAGLVATPVVLAVLTVLLAHTAPLWFLAWLYAGGLAGVIVGGRQVMLGVYVSDEGVISRCLTSTRRVAWPAVAGFRNAPATIGGIELGRDALFLDVAGDGAVQTAVLCRRRYGQFDHLPRFGLVRYWPDEYDEVLAMLQHVLRARRTVAEPPAGEVALQSAAAPPQPVRATRPPWHRAPAQFDNQVHLLTRKHGRGELTDEEFAAAMARLHSPNASAHHANQLRPIEPPSRRSP
jgi:hypothetical protein